MYLECASGGGGLGGLGGEGAERQLTQSQRSPCDRASSLSSLPWVIAWEEVSFEREEKGKAGVRTRRD